MSQLGELQDLYEEFKQRNVEIVAVSNEERSFMSHASVLGQLGFPPPFPVLCDKQWKATPRYERTTAYLIDKDGTVAQVFPMEIYDRPPWWALINEIDRLDGKRAALR